jgi:membrane-bound ClpP family serine protease
MDWWLVFAVFLYIVSACLIVAEVFVPSGGLIGIASAICLISGVWIFFENGTVLGWFGVVIASIMVPAVLIIAYRIFPNTRFGKAVTLTPNIAQPGQGISDNDNLKSLTGKRGKTLTALRPVGMCNFSGQKVETVAESGYVDKGKTVEVVNVQSTQITVRVIEQQEN